MSWSGVSRCLEFQLVVDEKTKNGGENGKRRSHMFNGRPGEVPST